MTERDDEQFERYLRGDDDLSTAYRRLAQPTPSRVIDWRVLERARAANRRRPRREALAYAACVLLGLSVLFAFEIRLNENARNGDAPRFVHTAAHGDAAADLRLTYPMLGGAAPAGRAFAPRDAIYSSDPQGPSAHAAARAPNPRVWLATIAALRKAGHAAAADAETRRFRAVYPGYRADRR